jgi:hypothetical protein
MTSADKDMLARVALLMLEELALRRDGRAKFKYWKTYRMAVFWLGKSVADSIVARLAGGGYIKIEGRYVILIKRFTHGKSLNSILKEAYNLLATGTRR